MAPAAAPRGCTGSASLGSFRIQVRRPNGGLALPFKSVSYIPPGSHLLWDPARLSPRIAEKGEVTAILVPAEGSLLALPPRKAGAHAEWAMPAIPAVVVLVVGPQGLSMGKVKSMVTRNQDLLRQLADYAEQTSEVEALVQDLADSEASGMNSAAALKGFASRYGVALPKLDTKAPTDQQASVLLQTLLPTANTYDPLAATGAQVQQSVGLAASVAGMFFGNGFGLAAGGTALVVNLKSALFPDTELRSAFAQSIGPENLALCTKSLAAKPRTRTAYLWVYRVPNLKPPVLAIAAASHVLQGTKSLVKLQPGEGASVKELERARDWQLAPEAGGAAIPVPVAMASPLSLQLDLSNIHPGAGDYRLVASWDWDQLSLGTVHVHAESDFQAVRIAPASLDRLVEGSGAAPVKLTGADFEFVDQVTMRKGSGKAAAAVPFQLPKGKSAGEQMSMTVEVDTAARGSYQLLLAQTDGKIHEVPVTILPPNPTISNLPLAVNCGDSRHTIRLAGRGLEQIESVSSGAGAITGAVDGASWAGEILLHPGLQTGEHFSLVLKIKGLDTPLTLDNAIEVLGPRPRIASVRLSLPGTGAVELQPGELPAGATLGMVLAVKGLRQGARTQLELGCQGGDAKRDLVLSPDEPRQGAALSFAGQDTLYLSLDPGSVGYAGCGLTAVVHVDPEGRSDARLLGRVLRVPAVEQFTLSTEQVGPDTYAGVLKGRDLDLVEKTGWDARHGLPVEAIPVPVPGEAGRQTLRIAVPWPSPGPHAPLYIWLRGEPLGRRTSAAY